MNWKEIGKKYPKASKKFLDSLKTSLHLYNDRDLYDFFDKQGIYIETLVDKTMEAKFCYEISQEIDFEWDTTGYSDLEYTRPKAEEAAFLKAFEILENK